MSDCGCYQNNTNALPVVPVGYPVAQGAKGDPGTPGVIPPSVQTFFSSTTLGAGNWGNILLFSNATLATVVLPTGGAVGVITTLFQNGAGKVTLSPGVGLTIAQSNSYRSTRAMYSQIMLCYVSPTQVNVWGDMST